MRTKTSLALLIVLFGVIADAILLLAFGTDTTEISAIMIAIPVICIVIGAIIATIDAKYGSVEGDW